MRRRAGPKVPRVLRSGYRPSIGVRSKAPAALPGDAAVVPGLGRGGARQVDAERVRAAHLAVDEAEGVGIRHAAGGVAEAAEDVDHALLLVDKIVAVDDVEHARRDPDLA